MFTNTISSIKPFHRSFGKQTIFALIFFTLLQCFAVKLYKDIVIILFELSCSFKKRGRQWAEQNKRGKAGEKRRGMEGSHLWCGNGAVLSTGVGGRWSPPPPPPTLSLLSVGRSCSAGQEMLVRPVDGRRVS